MKWLNKPYDRDLFEKYQTQLLYAANSRIGKWYLGINDKREVTKITNNSVHFYAGKRKHEAIFYGKPYFYNKIAKVAKVGLSLPFILNPSGLFVPLITTTFNPNASPTTTSVDGIAANNTTASFATMRAAAGNLSTSSPSGNSITAELLANAAGSNFDELTRGIFLFDTSALTTNAIIQSATFAVYVTANPDTFAQGGSVDLVLSNPASNTAIVNGDYNVANFTMTDQAAALTVAGMTTSAFNTWTLNATGLGNISKTSITKFGLVISFDFSNTSPTWGSSQVSRIACQFASNASGNKPKLTVVYTLGPGGNKGYTFII